MKKIFLILMTVLLFNCEQVSDFMVYWADITGDTAGTTETMFSFDVRTNDDTYSIYCDDELLESTRSTGYTFTSGSHIIKVVTENGAVDTLGITVSEKEVIIPEVIITTRFIIHNTTDDDSAENVASLDYPILNFDGVAYDVETMATDVNGFPVIASLVDNERQIHLYMNITDNKDTFLFHSGNMEMRLYFTEDELDITNMTNLLNYMNREEVAIEAVGVRFELQITEGSAFSCDDIQDEAYYMELDGDVSEDGIKTITIPVTIGSKTGFIAREANFMKFFRFSLIDLELVNLRTAVDILERYTSATLLDLVYEYDPTNPVLDEMGYFE